jgi:hypothetical protein
MRKTTRKKQEILGRIAYFPLIQHEPRRKLKKMEEANTQTATWSHKPLIFNYGATYADTQAVR